jgi:thioesterase domain-containing protein
MDIAAVEAYLHEHIPITRAMGFRVKAYDGVSVRLWAPLEPNLNHRQTAFGGSVAALATLSGWTLLYMKLREAGEDVQLVVQSSEIDYTGPIEVDFDAVCRMPAPHEWARFEHALRRYGRARVGLRAEIETNGQTMARYAGDYVAVRRRQQGY